MIPVLGVLFRCNILQIKLWMIYSIALSSQYSSYSKTAWSLSLSKPECIDPLIHLRLIGTQIHFHFLSKTSLQDMALYTFIDELILGRLIGAQRILSMSSHGESLLSGNQLDCLLLLQSCIKQTRIFHSNNMIINGLGENILDENNSNYFQSQKNCLDVSLCCQVGSEVWSRVECTTTVWNTQSGQVAQKNIEK